MDEQTAGSGGGVGPEADQDVAFVGRGTELSRLLRAVDPASDEPVVVLVGDTGVGKTALLGRVVRRAEARGVRVLRAEGSESESDLVFSALHQLLRRAHAEVDRLPERQSTALRSAFGTGPAVSGPTGAPDPMLIGLAVLSVLSALGDARPLLVVLDDAQWFDRASLDALSFAARRLEGEPVTMVVTARDRDRLPGFDRRTPVIALEPLDGEAANHLLDLQPASPTGLMRTRILDQAGGNPLALVELARAAAARTPGVGSPFTGPLPLPDHLERIFAARLAGLPAAARRALVVLAAMDGIDAGIAFPAGPPDAGDDLWLPAERAGLVRRTGQGLRFRHPLVRSAVYHAASAGERQEAHAALAELVRDEPDRRAWHRAAACSGPDAAVSAELERTADRARRRSGHAAAAHALQRAADLAPRRADSARLLVGAAGAAVPTGDLAWVEELTAAARALTDDPALLASADVQAGRLAVLTVRHTVVFSRLVQASEQLTVSRPAAALDLLTAAAVVRYYSGADTQLRRIEELLGHLAEDPSSTDMRIWVKAVSNPFDDRDRLVSLLPRLAAGAGRQPERLTAFGIMAWLLDETPQAVRAFDEAFDHWESQGQLPEGLGGAVAWAYTERGRWDQARAACARTTAVGLTAGLDHAVACAAAVDATVLAYQGDTTEARSRADEALALIDPLESRSVLVYARRALGAAAAADGAYETAYGLLRSVFTTEGAPLHYHASYPALAELAAAAARCGRRDDAAGVVERAARTLADDASPRLRALISRARGLLAEPEDAEPHFRAALADPVLAHWPFERAQTQLDLAEWLRRRRRITEARKPLMDALETFSRLGARPWMERTRAEARAAGLDATATIPDALAELSPQQRQIVGLAAGGLTNREIGEKLFLSPRTVGSHLYRSFPKLGITARSQLRGLIEGPLTKAAHQE
ncbi:helix-turn-helix transcriptional regulator [Streptomyces sp. ALB3]|uniref:helix-turn-helix transcriptional regulator n=1 Tax=Streptomyces sp. ALB3 TaxID=3374278 RepID=UPI00379106B3